MDDNPYLAPMVREPLAAPEGPVYYVVDDSLLVVRSGDVLPLFCVTTGVPVSPEQMERRILHWCPFWVFVLMFVAPFIGFVLYAILRKKCLITYGMSKAAKRPYWIRVGIACALMIAAAVGVLIGAKLKMGAILLCSVLLVPVAIIVMLVGNTPFSAIKYVDGKFWIKGSSPEFLARLD
jgi:hypothetical protein